MNTIQNNLLKNYIEKLNEIEEDWEKNRGNKFTTAKNDANSMSFIDWLNYGNKLLSQHKYNYMVVYNTSGTRIRSAVVENKTYWLIILHFMHILMTKTRHIIYVEY
ncbi:hypothetical protein [Acidiplasma cupricumulans]|uniref:hypothetical protein n=1 Tax=Acidiplasma cupricumulans TaxID=312540 RepID=UPI000781BC1E|nr:hypothetical protein [Acidiplasma cupricumulans]